MPQADLSYSQRRDKQRLPFKRQVQLESPTAGSMQVEGINYSPSGIAVHSYRQLPVGEHIRLCFPVGRNHSTEMEVGGEVIHSTLQGNGFMIGIRFMERIESPLNSEP